MYTLYDVNNRGDTYSYTYTTCSVQPAPNKELLQVLPYPRPCEKGGKGYTF